MSHNDVRRERALLRAPAQAAVLLAAAALVLAGGCQSTHPDAFAAVLIQGNTPGQISAVAAGVFREGGYVVKRAGMNSLVCEKKGSTMNDISYGNWTGNPVWVRVRTSISPVSEGVFQLECKAWLLRDRGETTEEEIKISSYRSGPYQKLLEEVARRLGSPNK